ncbi:MAG TPA: alpha/beta fold hydrolase [Pyrinomonadaceae bacterium]|jgi:alpha/beta superfamily hydrolase|nr:alpha/beta fold hydrolase [Pyrinomonadaceae bacterium]
MYPAGNLFIPVAHGRLEAILKEPRTAGGEGARGVALVLHPHPLHGGTMHNKVVFRAARALNDAGLVALRINFRGVGLSTGAHDHARGGEQEDARAALDYLAENYPNRPVTLAGFSFGARVGLEVGTRDRRVRRLVGIGTPVSILERDYDFSFLRECRKPLLLVQGERDEFGDVATLRRLAAELPPEARVRVEIIPGAGHFFDDQLEDLRRVIAEWAMETMNAEG